MATKKSESTETSVNDVNIVRTGTQIIIPEDMSIDEAIKWLRCKKEQEEKVISIRWDIPCYPTDGIIALYKALQEIYGFTGLRGNTGWFGVEYPPQIIQVPTGTNGETEFACLGKIQPPTFEGGFLQAHITGEPNLVVTGEVKMKFQSAMTKILAKLKEILSTKSIYRNKAVILDLSYLDPSKGGKFDALKHAPQFMDVSKVQDSHLILNPQTEFELNANVFTLLEATQACKDNNIPLKHGLLLHGPYGTGKTMTARVTAAKATRNNWTFIYLKQTQYIAQALKIAELYAPCVVFAEDRIRN